MFTGLIRDVGTIIGWQRRSNSVQFSISTKLPMSDLSLGASVACNGACLTIVACEASPNGHNIFQVEAGPETLALTRLGLSEFKGVGELINLEPALRMGDALGGHLVTGHVDARGKVIVNESGADGFWRLRIEFAPEFSKYIFLKGSVAVGGVSLTVAQCSTDEQWFEIMLIPHTLAQTNLQQLRPGSLVELEFDSQAKMVAQMLSVMLPSQLKTLISQS
jgi:riboflavin synthase